MKKKGQKRRDVVKMKEKGCFYFILSFFFQTFQWYFIILKVQGIPSYYFKYNDIFINKYIFFVDFFFNANS